MRDSRVDPGRRGALILIVVAALAALVAAVGVWRDRPEPRPVQAISLSQVTDGSVAPTSHAGSRPPTGLLAAPGVPPSAKVPSSPRTPGGAAPGNPSATPTATSPATTGGGLIVVSVTGAVHRPGLVKLTPDARVADAIDKAGGVTAQANLTGLNLAEKLVDGASVVVADIAGPSGGTSSVSNSGTSGSGLSASGMSGSEPPGFGAGRGSASSGSAAGVKLDLNIADVAALDALPGVGPVTAASIVAWRDKNGRFTSVEQLQEITGIGPAKYAALSPLVKV